MLPKLHGPCSRGGYSKTEMQRFNGIFAKSAIEKERISLRLIPPRRFHLTDKWRLIQRANPFPIHRDNPRFFRNSPRCRRHRLAIHAQLLGHLPERQILDRIALRSVRAITPLPVSPALTTRPSRETSGIFETVSRPATTLPGWSSTPVTRASTSRSPHLGSV